MVNTFKHEQKEKKVDNKMEKKNPNHIGTWIILRMGALNKQASRKENIECHHDNFKPTI